MHLIDARSTEIVDTWRLHNRVTVFLLDAIEPEVFRAPEPEVGRSAPAMLAHLHHVRLLWLQSAAPALYKGQEKSPEPRRPALLHREQLRLRIAALDLPRRRHR